MNLDTSHIIGTIVVLEKILCLLHTYIVNS